MAASHYVCVDVSSVYYVHKMTYYIRHNNKDFPHYVHLDKSSDYPAHYVRVDVPSNGSAA